MIKLTIFMLYDDGLYLVCIETFPRRVHIRRKLTKEALMFNEGIGGNS